METVIQLFNDLLEVLQEILVTILNSSQQIIMLFQSKEDIITYFKQSLIPYIIEQISKHAKNEEEII
jgi:hypothetical protein